MFINKNEAFINKNEAFDVMNSGILNDTLRGYITCAMHISGSSNEEINRVINALSYVLDSMNTDEAERYFNETRWIK